jgi:hypothetical protein
MNATDLFPALQCLRIRAAKFRAGWLAAVAALWCAGAPVPAASAAEPRLPIFDAHVHYSHDAWDRTPPKEAVAILRKAGLKRAMVSSSSDDGTQKLYAEAPDLVVPSLRPYRKRGELSTWVRDETVIPHLEDRLKQFRYAAIGEFHVYGADADLPVVRRMVQLAGSTSSGCTCTATATPSSGCWPGPRGAHPLGALGLRPPEHVREMLRKHRKLWCDLAFRNDHASGRQGRSRLARGLHRIPRPLPGRHRHLHARALVLHRRACRLVARVAGRPAARHRRAHRLAQRRNPVRLDDGDEKMIHPRRTRWRVLLALAGALAAAAAGAACPPADSDGSTIRKGTLTLAWRPLLTGEKAPNPAASRWRSISRWRCNSATRMPPRMRNCRRPMPPCLPTSTA